MAKTKISEFSSTPANNTDIDSINIAEGCAPSNINDAIRELMAQLKDFQTGAVGDSFNGPIGSSTASTGAFTNITASGTLGVTGVATLGAGAILNTPASVTLTNATGLPISTGVSGLGTGVATALAVNVGSAGAPVVNGGALGTPSSGTVTNLTGTASININGTVGATTPTTGAFTTLSASSSVTLSGGTANGVLYLNGSKVATSGSALTFDGTNFILGGGGYIAAASAGEVRAYNTANTRYGRFVTTADGTVLESFNGSGEPLILSAPQSSAYIGFKVNAAEQGRWTTTGLGIGTSSPATKLDVNGTGLVSSFGSNTVAETYVQVKNGTSTLYLGGSSSYNYVYGTASVPLTFWTNSTERMRLDASGNLIVGGTSAPLSASGRGNITINGSSTAIMNLTIGGTNKGYIFHDDSAMEVWNADNSDMKFATNNTERARIDSSGNLLVGKTAASNTDKGATIAPSGEMQVTLTNAGGGNQCIFLNREDADGTAILFRRANGTVGTISVTTTATAYNTSSDYRLKEQVQPMTGALAKVAALKPVTYKWKANGSDGEGFIAHELAEVVPQCVSGEKDAVDEDGNPVYQGIDTSFLAGLYAAALQELMAEVNILKAEIAILKAK